MKTALTVFFVGWLISTGLLSFAIYNLILCFEDLRAMLIDLRTDFVTKTGSGNSSESEDNNA